MKLRYKKIEFNPHSIHDIEEWDGEFGPKRNIFDSYMKGWAFTIIYEDQAQTKIDHTIHYIDTEVFTGITTRGQKVQRNIDEVKKVCNMYRENLERKEASIEGSKKIKKLIHKLYIEHGLI